MTTNKSKDIKPPYTNINRADNIVISTIVIAEAIKQRHLNITNYVFKQSDTLDKLIELGLFYEVKKRINGKLTTYWELELEPMKYLLKGLNIKQTANIKTFINQVESEFKQHKLANTSVIETLVVKDQQVMASSLDIADRFKVDHAMIIQIIKTNKHKFNQKPKQTFIQDFIQDSNYRLSYQMTKDGFIFLAASFTGKQELKDQYIAAFNYTEQRLQRSLVVIDNQTTNNLKTIEFNGIKMDIIGQDGDFYLTGAQIAEALEYSDRRAILKIYRKNKELLDEYSGVVKMDTPEGGTQETRIFNEEGCMLIAMKSNKPKAIEFQKWAVKVLKQQRYQKQSIPAQDKPLAYQADNLANQGTPIALKQHASGIYINSTYLAKLLKQSHSDIVAQVKALIRQRTDLPELHYALNIKKIQDGYLLGNTALFCLKLNHSNDAIYQKLRIFESFANIEKRLIITLESRVGKIKDYLDFEQFNVLNEMSHSVHQISKQINKNPSLIKTQIGQIKPILKQLQSTYNTGENKKSNDVLLFNSIGIVLGMLDIIENNNLDHQLNNLLGQLNDFKKKTTELSKKAISKHGDCETVLKIIKQLGKHPDNTNMHTVPYSDKSIDEVQLNFGDIRSIK